MNTDPVKLFRSGIGILRQQRDKMHTVAGQHLDRSGHLFWHLLQIDEILTVHRLADAIGHRAGGKGETDIVEA